MPSSRKYRELALLALLVVLAAALRFSCNEDMEFKGDESWMFERTRAVGRTEGWPLLGMPSGAGPRNPGMSVWAFVALARITGASTPLALDRAVVLTNVLAFALLALFIRRCVEQDRREPWIWGMALAAVNPFEVLIERKIWAQSILPLFAVAFLWAWWRRDRRVGAFAWGALGACLGQIHMSGFFYALAFVLATAWAARVDSGRRVRWGAWLLGSALASIPLVPWVRYMASGSAHGVPLAWSRLTTLTYPAIAATQVLGVGLDYSLGSDYRRFLREPAWLPALYIQGLGAACAVVILFHTLRHLMQKRDAWRTLPRWPASVSDTALACFAGLPLFGVLLTFGSPVIYRHYLHVDFPLEGVLLALLALRWVPRGRVWLGGIAAACLGLTLAFLHFIHVHGGALGGDYGAAYRGP